jgi:short-subunit dehydrogenase
MKARNKTIVVTGGGSGIGRELVLQLLTKGARVAATDVHDISLQETAKLAGDSAKHLSIHVFDLADKEKIYALPSEIIKIHGTIDGIINNAGIIQPFVSTGELALETAERLFQVNFFGTFHMIKAFLPHLLKRSESHIVNVCSMGGFIPFPGQTVYGASKAAMKMLTEGLNSELKNTPVRITLALPGAVDTNIMENSGVNFSSANPGKKKHRITRADVAAKKIISGMEKNTFRVFVGSDARLMDILYRLMPDTASHFIAVQMGKLYR